MANHTLVPDNMSPVNAFYCLWANAEVDEIFIEKPHLLAKETEAFATSEKVAYFIRQNPHVYYAGGKKVFVDFTKFPKIDTKAYDVIHGEGAAERRLRAYHCTPSDKRFDQGDKYVHILKFMPMKFKPKL